MEFMFLKGRNCVNAAPVAALVLAFTLALAGPAAAAPAAPNWLPGQPLLAGNQVIAMWLPVPGAVKYIVYLDGKKIAELPANQYMGLAPEKAGDHKFEISAVDGSGAESARSKAGVIKIVKLEPPTGLMARPLPAEKAATIRWTTSPGAVIANVYRAESKDGPWKLLESLQGDSYKDATIELGKDYWYTVSGKDISGKESGRSEVINVKVVEAVGAAKKEKIKIDMVVVPTKEVRRLSSFGLNSTKDVGSVVRTSDGKLWIATGEKAEILVVNEADWTVERQIKPKQLLAEQGLPFKNATDISLIEDDRFVVVDGFVGTIYCFDIDGKYLWHTKPVLPPEDREELWVDLHPTIKKKKLLPNHPIFLEDGTLFVTEVQGPIVYVIDPDNGEIYDWWSGYQRDGEHFSSFGISVIREVAPGLVWAGEPFGRRVIAFDPESREVKYVVGEKSSGFIGGFLGISDIRRHRGEEVAFIADSGVGTLQAFNIKDGTYLYHFGGEKVEADPKLSFERPVMEIGSLGLILFDEAGNLITKAVFEGIISVREVAWDKKEVVKKE